MKQLILAAALLLAPTAFTPPAIAQAHRHGDKKGPHGGPIQDIVGIEAELLLAERTITIHIYDEAGKPIPASGYAGSALVGAGQARQVIQLAPAADNTLSGTAANPIPRATPVALQLKAPGGNSGQAKF